MFFFWINKNLLPRGKNPQQPKTNKQPKATEKNEKRTAPPLKLRGRGISPDKDHLISNNKNKDQQPTAPQAQAQNAAQNKKTSSNTNKSISIISSGPHDIKRKSPSLAQTSFCGVVNYILEACDPKPDIITNEIENRIDRNKLVLVNSCITLSP